MRRPFLLDSGVPGFPGLGCPLSRQLLHLSLLRYRSECTLAVVYDEVLPSGADIPRLWHDSLEELEAHV
jgi:hypothetical protein